MTLIKRALTVAAMTSLLLLVAAPAFAHVTVRVDNPAAGAFAKYTVRVPNEADDAATVSIEVELPAGFEEARYQPLAGWDISVSDGVLTIEGGRIAPGEFQEFSFSAQNPEAPGDVVFPAIQTYDNGEEVRWVGEPDSDKPASVVTIEPGEAEAHSGDDDEPTEAPASEVVVEPSDEATDEATEVVTDPAVARSDDEADEVAADATSSQSDSGSSTLSILALVAGLLGLILGGVALSRTRGTQQR